MQAPVLQTGQQWVTSVLSRWALLDRDRHLHTVFGPFTVAEQVGSGTRPLFDRLTNGEKLLPATEPPDLRGYVDLALRGGFPEVALGMSGRARERWLDSHVDQLLTRDALHLESGRDPQRLERFFEAYALSSAELIEDKTIYDAAGINRKTANAYLQLLKNLLVIDELPSWTSNRRKRLVKSPKRYLIDPTLLGGALGVDAAAILRDGDLLGRLLDTFVVAQLRAKATVAEARPRMYHLRQEDGRHEVDIVAEIRGVERLPSRSRRAALRRRTRRGTQPGCAINSMTRSSQELCSTRPSNVLPGREARRSPDLHAVVEAITPRTSSPAPPWTA